MNRIGLQYFILLTLIVLSNVGLAQDVTFSTNIAAKKVGLSDRFEVTYSSNKQGEFILPEYKNFNRVGGIATGYSSNTDLNSGVTRKTFDYTVTLQPKKIGTFTVEGAKIKVGKGTYQSKAAKIEVVKESQVKNRRQSLIDQFLGGGRPDQRQEQVEITNQDIFVTLEAVNPNVYRNQPVLVEYKLYVNKYKCQLEGVEIPTYSNFLSDEIAFTQKSPEKKTINDKEYEVHTLKKVLLTPQKTGKLGVEAYKVQARVHTGGFMGTSVIMESNSLEINVKELPKPMPANFSNQVGSYAIQVVPMVTRIEKDNPIQFKLEVIGEGNIKQLVAPEFSFPEGFESYDPEIATQYAPTDSSFAGKVTFSYLLIPRELGQFTIPKQEFTYFDVATESYKSVFTKEVKFTVANGSGSASDFATEDTEQLTPEQDESQSNSWVWITIIPLSILAFVGAFLLISKKNSKEKVEETEEERRKNARNKLAKKLAIAKSHLDRNNVSEFYNEILIGINKYVNEKLEIETAQMNKITIRETLNSKGVEEKTVDSFVNVLEQCEMAKYAPLSNQNNLEIYEKSLDVIEEIERVIN